MNSVLHISTEAQESLSRLISTYYYIDMGSKGKQSKAENGAESLESIVKRVVEALLQSDTFLQSIVSAITDSVANRVTEELKATVCFNTETVHDFHEELKSRDRALQLMKTDFDRRLDEMEQYQRRSNLRIFGVPESEGNSDLAAIQTAKRIGVDLDLCDIDRSHRVGAPQAGKCRPIIVKFTSYRKRSEIFRNKRGLKNSGVTLREDLTQARVLVLKAAIEKFQLKNVWTSDGVIIVKKGDVKIRVMCMNDLATI